MIFITNTKYPNYIIDFLSEEWQRNNLIALTFMFALIFVGRFLNKKQNSFVLYTMGVILMFSSIYSPLRSYLSGNWNIATDLPLHLCGISALICSVLPFLKRKQALFDFVFYTEAFSISQSEKPSIQSSFAHISGEQAMLNPDCKPIGRIFYQIEGVNRFEAEFFLSQDCIYYLFYQNGKKMYASKMTQQGFNFFANIYKQIGKPIQ